MAQEKNNAVQERVYVQIYSAFATCLIFMSYFVFSLQIISATNALARLS